MSRTSRTASKGRAPPVTFIFNGGPGSATFWLHMGAFGPRRIVTSTDAHTPAAPYSLVNNGSSLLDASDLVFIDAPGTGFSRIAGKDKEKAFYGVDADAYAFSEFISQFLSKYARWNSPKYMFGESYGTPRAAVLINQLEADRSIDFNGVILLSQILNFDLSPDRPTGNPGIDLPYQTVLPTYAATAWYHKKLPADHPSIEPFLTEVEQFAMGEYARALAAGSDLSANDKAAVAEKLHQYTGLPVDYILKADLRIDGGEFRQTLKGAEGMSTGRLDSRFSGPSSTRWPSALTTTHRHRPWAPPTFPRSTIMPAGNCTTARASPSSRASAPSPPGISHTNSRARTRCRCHRAKAPTSCPTWPTR